MKNLEIFENTETLMEAQKQTIQKSKIPFKRGAKSHIWENRKANGLIILELHFWSDNPKQMKP